MKLRTLLIVAMLAGAALAQTSTPEAPALLLHLPRTVETGDSPLQVGTVAVIHCDDASVSGKAAQVPLGRAPWLNEKLAITRATILNRLVSAGISAKRIRFSGAQKVVVQRNEKQIPADRIIKAARDFLKTKLPEEEFGRTLLLVGKVQPVVIPADRKVGQLEGRMPANQTPNYVRIEVVVDDGTPKPPVAALLYRRVAPEKKPAPPRPRGTPGIVLKKKDGELPILVKRSQKVVMRVRGPGFLIIGLGQAMQDGRQDDHIRIQNVDTRRVITARVAPDGVVEPLMKSLTTR